MADENRTTDAPRHFGVTGMADGSERYEIEISGPLRSIKLRNVIRVLTFYAEMIEQDERAEAARRKGPLICDGWEGVCNGAA